MNLEIIRSAHLEIEGRDMQKFVTALMAANGLSAGGKSIQLAQRHRNTISDDKLVCLSWHHATSRFGGSAASGHTEILMENDAFAGALFDHLRTYVRELYVPDEAEIKEIEITYLGMDKGHFKLQLTPAKPAAA